MPRINRVPDSGVKGSLALKILRARQTKNLPFWINKNSVHKTFEQRYRDNKPFWQK